MDPFHLALSFWLLTQKEERNKEGKIKKVGIYNVERSSSPSQSFVVVVLKSSVKIPPGTPDDVDAVVICASFAFAFSGSAKIVFFFFLTAW